MGLVKNIVLFILIPLLFVLTVWLFPFYLANYLDAYFNLPQVFTYPSNLIGLLLIATALMLNLYATMSFLKIGKGTPFPWRPPKKLVIAGPYRYTRNSLYLSYVLFMSGLAILTDLVSLFLTLAVFMILLNFAVIYWEEPQLEKRFGRAYLKYKKEVPRWFPKLK